MTGKYTFQTNVHEKKKDSALSLNGRRHHATACSTSYSNNKNKPPTAELNKQKVNYQHNQETNWKKGMKLGSRNNMGPALLEVTNHKTKEHRGGPGGEFEGLGLSES